MSKIVAYMPTYAPDGSDEPSHGRPLNRLTNIEIADRINNLGAQSRTRPYVYLDCIDSIVNMNPEVKLVVGDARSSEIIRSKMIEHHKLSGGYELELYQEKMSQWKLMNDIIAKHTDDTTKYFVYTSSDIIWTMDWVNEAIKEFEGDPSLQIIFPTVSFGDTAIPVQLAPGPVDRELIDPADHMACPGMAAAKAPCLNAYAIIFNMDFFRKYGGYMDVFRNCFTESFLYFQCEAMGGKMRLMPRGWVFHHNGCDVWIGEGGHYHYLAERPIFESIMPSVQTARAGGVMTVDYLKDILYAKA